MAKSIKKRKRVVLIVGEHFTLTALAAFLNKSDFKKESGEPYTAMDVQKYLRRGHLPEYLGGCALGECRYPDMGLRLIKLDNPNK